MTDSELLLDDGRMAMCAERIVGDTIYSNGLNPRGGGLSAPGIPDDGADHCYWPD